MQLLWIIFIEEEKNVFTRKATNILSRDYTAQETRDGGGEGGIQAENERELGRQNSSHGQEQGGAHSQAPWVPRGQGR